MSLLSIGTSVVASPAKLQAAAIGFAVLVSLVAALTAWGFYERSERMSCEVGKVALAAQVTVLDDKIDTQNAAVAGWKAAAEMKKAVGAEAMKGANAAVAAMAPELARLEGKISEKIKSAAAKSCSEGAAEVRKGLNP